jgi:hypothetical protein
MSTALVSEYCSRLRECEIIRREISIRLETFALLIEGKVIEAA